MAGVDFLNEFLVHHPAASFSRASLSSLRGIVTSIGEKIAFTRCSNCSFVKGSGGLGVTSTSKWKWLHIKQNRRRHADGLDRSDSDVLRRSEARWGRLNQEASKVIVIVDDLGRRNPMTRNTITAHSTSPP